MDHAAFHIVYVDKRVSANLDGKYLHNAVRDSPAEKGLAFRTDQQLNCFQLISSEMGLVRDNLSNLLSSFRGGRSTFLQILEPAVFLSPLGRDDLRPSSGWLR